MRGSLSLQDIGDAHQVLNCLYTYSNVEEPIKQLLADEIRASRQEGEKVDVYSPYTIHIVQLKLPQSSDI